MNKAQRSRLINRLIQVGEAVYRTIGPQCEVVVHDLSDMEQSIVWIKGVVTERNLGGCMTARGLSLVRAGRTEDSYNYTTRTRSGKMVRSSLIFFNDRQGDPLICMEINFDASPFVAFRRALETLADPVEVYDFQDAFIDDAPQMLETMFHRAADFIGKPTTQMDKTDRLRMVQLLDDAGAFELRKAIPTIAGYLGVTRFTIHNYLNEIRGKATPNSADEAEETSQGNTHPKNETQESKS
ncbi:MAG: PAS domain-containing protein [Chloroflexi bacterium]|nr:PAS domain-containing protein [Chloroflexota bacterium]